MIPRANKILMIEEVKPIVLYSDDSYMEDNFWRSIIAHVYSDSARASYVELRESSFDDLDCSMKTNRCYTYKGQELYSYGSAYSPYVTLFSTSYRVRRHIARKLIELGIGSSIRSAETFVRVLHLESRHRVDEQSIEYILLREFHLLV
jgi:hypothetical protein